MNNIFMQIEGFMVRIGDQSVFPRSSTPLGDGRVRQLFNLQIQGMTLFTKTIVVQRKPGRTLNSLHYQASWRTALAFKKGLSERGVLWLSVLDLKIP